MTVGKFFSGSLEATTTVGGCIDIYENAWLEPESTIQSVENEVNIAGSGIFWNRAATLSKGTKQNERTNLDMGITHSAEMFNNGILQNIHNQMYVLLAAALKNYCSRYGIEDELWHEKYNMLKYNGGNEYKAHYDGNTITHRAVSAIIYLNDDYEGGELEFTNFGLKIKPQAGMLLIFPSNYAYTHIAHPVISGTKYALVTWTHDQPIVGM